MSSAAIAWAYKVNATPQERNVLFVLAAYADEHNIAWPGLKAIGNLACMKRIAVIRALNKLENSGWITRTERGGPKRTTTYRLNTGMVSKTILDSIENDTQLKESLSLLNTKDSVSKTILPSIPDDTTEDDPEPFRELNDKFKNLSRIIVERDTPRWVQSINRMLKNGVTPEVMTQAFAELGNNYTISGPWSLETACSNVVRKNGHNESAPAPETYATEVY
jgi:hypothetical protein